MIKQIVLAGALLTGCGGSHASELKGGGGTASIGSIESTSVLACPDGAQISFGEEIVTSVSVYQEPILTGVNPKTWEPHGLSTVLSFARKTPSGANASATFPAAFIRTGRADISEYVSAAANIQLLVEAAGDGTRTVTIMTPHAHLYGTITGCRESQQSSKG